MPTHIVQAPSISKFKTELKSFLGPGKPPKFYLLGSKRGNMLHTRLRVGLTNLKDHQFRIGNAISPHCDCGFLRETTQHYILSCALFGTQRDLLFNALSLINNLEFARMTERKKIETLLHGTGLDESVSRRVATEFQKYILATGHL